MKRKLILIAIPIVISIVGVIWFQIDWVSKTYTFELKKMNALADTALRRAIAEINLEQEDSVSRFLMPKLSPLTDSVRISFSANGDSILVKLNNQIRFEGGLYGIERQSYDVERVEIDWPIYAEFPKEMLLRLGILAITKDQVIINKLDEIIAPFIKTRDSLYYQSDSIKIDNYMKKRLSSFGIDDPTQLYFFKGSNIQLESKLAAASIIKEYKPQGMNRYTGERRWVGVYFHGHDRYILSKMLLGSLLSIGLILIMIASFIYLIRTILQQKRLAEMKDDFIDNLTHEFKTPIATIAVAIEGLQNFNALNDKEKTDRYLTISKNELNRLNSMVSNVLNLASQEKRSIELNVNRIDLTNMIQEVIAMEHFRGAKEVNFVLAIDKEVNQLNVDPVHFKNVITNLIDNAVKYSKETVEISFIASRQKNNVSIIIKDNGIGIRSADLNAIFDKFYRVSNGNIYNVKGIGLGLNYVKSIILAHGGTITVKSEMNVGTEFSILIPLN